MVELGMYKLRAIRRGNTHMSIKLAVLIIEGFGKTYDMSGVFAAEVAAWARYLSVMRARRSGRVHNIYTKFKRRCR